MISKLNSSDGPSFQANLKINGLNLGSAKKMKEVERLFVQKTQHYADDVLEITHLRQHNDYGAFFHTAEFNVNGKNVASKILGSLKDFCNNNSAEDVAKGLVRVFKYGKARGKFAAQRSEKAESLRRVLISDLNNSHKALIKRERGDNLWAQRYQILADTNRAKANSLRGEIEKIDNKKSEVLNTITDHPIFEDSCP